VALYPFYIRLGHNEAFVFARVAIAPDSLFPSQRKRFIEYCAKLGRFRHRLLDELTRYDNDFVTLMRERDVSLI